MLAGDLARAGLRRINISCDSLRPDRFAAITGRDALAAVLDGIDAALVAGLRSGEDQLCAGPGLNDDEILDFAAFGRDRGVELRFIEWMPLDGGGKWSADQVVPARRSWPPSTTTGRSRPSAAAGPRRPSATPTPTVGDGSG